MTWRVFTYPGYVVGSGLRLGEPDPITRMDLASNLILQRGIGPATFTRSTTGTFVDKDDGLIKAAAIDEARFETNGVLIEGASTNLLLRSEEFDDVAWAVFRTTVVGNSTLAPDNTMTADSINETVDDNSHVLRQTVTLSASTTYTFSAYVKKLVNDFVKIRIQILSGATRDAYFNINTGVVGNVSGSSVVASITSAANGFFRISITLDSSTGPATPHVDIRMSQDGTDDTYIGNVNNGVIVWGAQIEQLPFASSYIKTIATSVTRASDNLSIDAANIPVPTADYSISAEVDILGDAGGAVRQVVYAVEGENFRFLRAKQFTNTRAFHGAVDSADIIDGISVTGVQNLTTTFDGTNFIFYQNTVSQGTLSSFTSITGTKTSISLGKLGASQHLFGHIKNFKIFDVRLTADEVANL